MVVRHETINQVSYSALWNAAWQRVFCVQIRFALFTVYGGVPREKEKNARCWGTIADSEGGTEYTRTIWGEELQLHTAVPMFFWRSPMVQEEEKKNLIWSLCCNTRLMLREVKQRMGRLRELAAWRSLITFSTHSITNMSQTQHTMDTFHCSITNVASRTEMILVTLTYKDPE